ncbi:MAG: flagellar biosynthesis protein FliR [Synergistaceae bacterium]|jgi:hypothetical protein|nr:flagellar biosynthesis protein FliR [Synergistaceae bacterium]
MNIPIINIQALVALLFFLAALFVGRAVVKIYAGVLPGFSGMVFYLRVLLGFLLAGAIFLAYYSFIGVDVISGN